MDWGDVPTWVSAVTTTFALVAAGLVVWIELKREARTSEEGRAEQAHLVGAWLRFFNAEEVAARNIAGVGNDTYGEWFIEVHNGSPLAVYDGGIDLIGDDVPDGLFSLNVQTIPPGWLHIPLDELALGSSAPSGGGSLSRLEGPDVATSPKRVPG